MQTSDRFRLGALLAFSGGLQDAYTYNVRDRVFANAQTGNVVLMSQNLMSGNILQGLRYLCPLICFSLGVFAAHRMEAAHKYRKFPHWRQAVLLMEIAVLLAVGFLPVRWNLAANCLVSFSCAMQVQAFRQVRGYGYASTMCIGNLRSGTESLSRYFVSGDRAALHQAAHLFGIILVFALGAGLGGVLSGMLGIRTIWISPAILLAAAAMMLREE